MEDKELELGIEKGYEEVNFNDLTESEKIALLEQFYNDEINEEELAEDDVEEYYEEETMSYEEELGKLTVAEEVRRLENMKGEYNPSDITLGSVFYTKGVEIADTIVAMVKVMNNNGIDYQNALTIANNYFMGQMQKDLDDYSKNKYKVGQL